MNAVISDIIMNYRTVISFGQKSVDKIIGKYNNLAKGPLDRSQKRSFWAGAANGWGQGARITFVALSFTLGNIIVMQKLGLHFCDVLFASGVMFFSLMSIGGASQNVPSI